MEYVALGSLDNFIRSEKEKIQQTDLLAIAHQIIMGMNYLQQKQIIHRDLALRNLLLCQEMIRGQSKYVVKITGKDISIFLKVIIDKKKNQILA